MCGNLLSSTYHLNSTQSSLFWHVLMYWATFMKIDDDWIKSNLSFSKPHDHSMGGMLKLISRDNIRMLFDLSNHHETRTRTKTTKSPLMTLQERVLKQSVSSVHLTWLIDLICWLIDLTDLIWLTQDMFTLLISGVMLLRIVLYLYCTAWSCSSSCSRWLIVAWNSPAMQDDASANADICENLFDQIFTDIKISSKYSKL